MELYDVMTTTFSGRDYTDEPLPDETLYRILDRARFAPSGGNRQGWKVIVVRDRRPARAWPPPPSPRPSGTPRRYRSARARGTPSTVPAWTRPPSSGPRRPRA